MTRELSEKSALLNVRGTFNSPSQAIPWLINNEVDLLILDVEMPGMSGLEMVRALWYKPEIIIISANAGYAVEAFDLSVTDYLVKPVMNYARFLEAINKVIIKRKKKPADAKSKDENLFVKIDSLLLSINLDIVLWIEAFGDYIKIVTEEKTYTVYSTLKKIETRLDKKKFVKVHRSFIINVSKITNIDPNNLVINKKIIPISGSYKDNLLNLINIL